MPGKGSSTFARGERESTEAALLRSRQFVETSESNTAYCRETGKSGRRTERGTGARYDDIRRGFYDPGNSSAEWRPVKKGPNHRQNLRGDKVRPSCLRTAERDFPKPQFVVG